MPGRLRLELTEAQRAELEDLRDHAEQPYLRERAAALLKVAAGWSAWKTAREGLLKPRYKETVSEWVRRYQRQGVSGLEIRKGRGRKPAYFPGLSRPAERPGSAHASDPSSPGRR
jgi:hypothetical protein